ncbi:hypothetical protein [Botrimarina sp.]|uniref:hypothetical protein n=1 Tax=Botrimarina sp. TaxID=2795802 RepID=UPI0032EE30DD
MPASSITADTSAAHAAAAAALARPFFDPIDRLGALTPVGYGDLPADYQNLLAHTGHMTITLEAWHESLVAVRVVGEDRQPDSYARHSLLARETDGRIVQSGVMRIDLTGLPMAVRAAVELGETPLGRILIRANLLREVEPLALWRIGAGKTLAAELGCRPGEVIFGRSARILVEGEPAVELLEIVRP